MSRRPNPWFSPPAFNYVAWPNPPAQLGYDGLDEYDDDELSDYDDTCDDCGEDVAGCYCANPGSLGPVAGPYAANPLEFHQGGSHRYHGYVYPGSGRRHHHGRRPSQFHPGGGTSYNQAYHPGGGHYEANPFLGFGGPPEPPSERDWFAPNPFFGFGGPPEPPPEREWFARANPLFGPPEPPASWRGNPGYADPMAVRHWTCMDCQKEYAHPGHAEAEKLAKKRKKRSSPRVKTAAKKKASAKKKAKKRKRTR